MSGYFPTEAAEWEPEHYSARWTTANRAPRWWAVVDLAWSATRGAIDVRACAAHWGWRPVDVLRFVHEQASKRITHGVTEDRAVWSAFDAQPIETNIEDGTLFEMPGPLTHADVVQRAVRWLRGHHKCNPVYAEIVTYERVNPDAIGFRKAAGSTRAWSVLVEAKISRADFRADQGKIIHRLPDSCPGQERWYLTPPNLLRASEIPDGWGLAECGARSVRIVKAAPHGDPVPERMHADMGILVAAARRHRIGVKWNDDTAKFAPYSSATEDE